MKAININQRNEVAETNLNYLATEDQNHLDNVFSIYTSHITHVSDLLQSIERKNKEYENPNVFPDEQKYFSLKNIEKAIEALRDTLESLTQSLVLKLENYFAKKYCLAFSSLIPDRGDINLEPLPSYDLIVENIAGQVGKDFLQAGKGQIKSRFLKSFYRSCLPTMKGNKITIPSFISLDGHYDGRISLSYERSERLEYLLNALNLFHNDSTALPERVTVQFSDWKRELALTTQYSVFPDVSFKFFKNRRIDILFSSAIIARKFWNYYTLEIIAKLIQEND